MLNIACDERTRTTVVSDVRAHATDSALHLGGLVVN